MLNKYFLALVDRSEYVQQQDYIVRRLTILTRSVSPFWRTKSASSAQSHDGRKVVGASYSHADILKIDSVYA